MSLVQIRIECEEKFRDCPDRCFGCPKARVVEMKNLLGKPRPDSTGTGNVTSGRRFERGRPGNSKG